MQHIAITGATGGIGSELARAFDDGRYKLTLVDLDRAKLDGLQNQIQAESFVQPCDLSDLDNCCNWIAPAEEALGKIDILINNAGIQYTEPAVEVSRERVTRIMNVNLVAPLHILHVVGQQMKARRSGIIANVSSAGIFFENPWNAHYISSKAGIAAATEIIRDEMKEYGVTVIPIYPGPIETKMYQDIQSTFSFNPLKLLPSVKPESMAKAIKQAIENKTERLIYPEGLYVGYLLPFVSKAMARLFGPSI